MLMGDVKLLAPQAGGVGEIPALKRSLEERHQHLLAEQTGSCEPERDGHGQPGVKEEEEEKGEGDGKELGVSRLQHRRSATLCPPHSHGLAAEHLQHPQCPHYGPEQSLTHWGAHGEELVPSCPLLGPPEPQTTPSMMRKTPRAQRGQGTEDPTWARRPRALPHADTSHVPVFPQVLGCPEASPPQSCCSRMELGCWGRTSSNPGVKKAEARVLCVIFFFPFPWFIYRFHELFS